VLPTGRRNRDGGGGLARLRGDGVVRKLHAWWQMTLKRTEVRAPKSTLA
jgi:hypothetical protein